MTPFRRKDDRGHLSSRRVAHHGQDCHSALSLPWQDSHLFDGKVFTSDAEGIVCSPAHLLHVVSRQESQTNAACQPTSALQSSHRTLRFSTVSFNVIHVNLVLKSSLIGQRKERMYPNTSPDNWNNGTMEVHSEAVEEIAVETI
eukprot:TRINITY_DN2606_c0_g3_i2.p2 TRINITY_DN2606_c0_g3~~TRINITY_DN2606_c0_g3_i2.p2  ORF type:complete len:144 (-),score=16.12 TRINITY_DN2606_c0_g3_i2:310-741(-)